MHTNAPLEGSVPVMFCRERGAILVCVDTPAGARVGRLSRTPTGLVVRWDGPPPPGVVDLGPSFLEWLRGEA